MNRRYFLKAIAATVIVGGVSPSVLAKTVKGSRVIPPEKIDPHIKDYLHKMKYPNRNYKEDIYLDRAKFQLLKSAVNRLRLLQRTVGYGNFYLLNFDGAIKSARYHRKVGRFPRKELEFLEMIFYEDGALYGFFGEKPLKNLTDKVKKKNVIKVPNTGNYLYKGTPFETYKRIKRDIGPRVVLTSGVRSIMKQFYLFLNKAYKCKGNLSRASRSLAPPGYSFHGVGDFDVGQVGLGIDNFSSRFAKTPVFRKLQRFGYLQLRYPQDNLLGVRFEPWHIKVNS